MEKRLDALVNTGLKVFGFVLGGLFLLSLLIMGVQVVGGLLAIDVAGPVRGACTGTGTATAGTVRADHTAINHIVVLDRAGANMEWTGQGGEWKPSSVADVELRGLR